MAARSGVPGRVFHPRAGQRCMALARQSGDLRRPEADDRRRHQKLGQSPDIDFIGWLPRHPDRGRARRRPLWLGARAPLGCSRWLRSDGAGLVGLGMGAGCQPAFRAERAHPDRSRPPCDHDRSLRFCPSPGLRFRRTLVVGIALALGSLWALLPAALFGVVLVIRTNLEDATLQRELLGYAGYAARVRSKWIPGVW